jgi:hypothetical protein
MPRRLIEAGSGKPLLDIASYARPGPGRRDHLSRDEIELIARTAGRTPEVMVKVLSRGGQDVKAVGRHIAYLNRGGDVEIETDDGQRLSGNGVEKDLLEDWDLDLDEHRRTADLLPRPNRSPPKLVHKVIFSMPAGTPSDKVLAAVKNFAREEFALQHRYAMVLHTDEPHPHVHMVIKAMSEQGVRLNISKPTLRGWRREFARHLRAEGIEANATERAVRGNALASKPDGIFRANLRGESTHMRQRAQQLARELVEGDSPRRFQDRGLLRTRSAVMAGWRAVSAALLAQGERDLAGRVERFMERMPPPQSEQEALVESFLARRRSVREIERPGSR